MNSNFLVLYGNPTPSDLRFIHSDPSKSHSSTLSLSSTRSDAQSAPSGLDQFFPEICDEYSRYVHEAGRVLPPEWTMPDLVRTVLGDEALQQGFLTDAYYDVMLCGTHSWGCEELLNLLDLINYS
ncbi:orf124 (mitochondrion) [Beta vulgaris subsp. vulgaris]|uniref:Orf124 protein n=1 Tax=Beta vulgaris subsp. vulgaris TaxID=3555 RepID=Q9MF37_BETVV|nr:orf124 [Beta vulgaris subsp. vulgaris]BAA99500.1 orf124 [Beta vulgaris subsp. vulgaris]